MKREDRLAYVRTKWAECEQAMAGKGLEYSRGEEDANSNFKRVAEALNMRPVQVALVYFLKHVDSITNWVKTGNTPSGEPIEGRITDGINYLLIIGSLIQEEKRP